MKRIIISIVLIVAMIFSGTCSAFAAVSDNYIEKDASGYLIKTNIDEAIISVLSDFCNSEVVVNEKRDCLKMYYTLENGETGYARKVIKDDTEIYFFKEGEKENTLVKKSDGTIYLDGEEVLISTNSIGGTDKNNTVELRGRHYNVTSYYTTVPSKTKSSEYSVYVRKETINVNFKKTVISLTVGALVTLLTGGLLAIAEAGFIVGTLVSLATGTFTGVILALQEDYPLSRGAKIELTRYQRKNGYMIPTVTAGEIRYAYKDNLKYFAKKNDGTYAYFDSDCRYRLTRIKS